MPEAPISPHYSVGAVVAAATSTLDPDLTPEDRALQVCISSPLPPPASFSRSCPLQGHAASAGASVTGALDEHRRRCVCQLRRCNHCVGQLCWPIQLCTLCRVWQCYRSAEACTAAMQDTHWLISAACAAGSVRKRQRPRARGAAGGRPAGARCACGRRRRPGSLHVCRAAAGALHGRLLRPGGAPLACDILNVRRPTCIAELPGTRLHSVPAFLRFLDCLAASA